WPTKSSTGGWTRSSPSLSRPPLSATRPPPDAEPPRWAEFSVRRREIRPTSGNAVSVRARQAGCDRDHVCCRPGRSSLWWTARRLIAAVKVKERAPAVSSAEIEVAADPELVWDVLTAMEDWPSWNPEVQWASMEGELTKGSRFRWKAGPSTITSTLQRVERPRLIAWTGKTVGLRAIHVYRLEAPGVGTLVSTAESWEGPVARVFRRRLQLTLARATEA